MTTMIQRLVMGLNTTVRQQPERLVRAAEVIEKADRLLVEAKRVERRAVVVRRSYEASGRRIASDHR